MAVKSESNVKRKAALAVKFSVKQERNATLKKVHALLKKTEVDRSDEEKQFLLNCIDLVKEVRHRIERQKKLKERLQEVEDPPDVVAAKCICLVEALSKCRKLVVYTGAGVSTAACIPDYRGSNGIWTLLQQGKDIGSHDLTKAEPTLTHMALTQLYRIGLVKHVVSQNCDGLHLRSGLPKDALSEVHGNMYIEVCRQCQPVKEYLRLFDVTENTARFSHRTGRRCYVCAGSLVDSIVHFGERGTLKWPLNWPGAVAAAANADAILCIGSSLKVLKKYPWLWGMDKAPKKRPKLYIINLQWTPKDDHAVLKINAKCDVVMKQVMSFLQIEIPSYTRLKDPIFPHATPLHQTEQHTTTKPFIVAPVTTFNSCLSQNSQEVLSEKWGKFSSVCGNKIENKDIKRKSESITCSSNNVKSILSVLQGTKEENDAKVFTKLVTDSLESHDFKKDIMETNSNNASVLIEQASAVSLNLCSATTSYIKQDPDIEKVIEIEPSMEIIYEGVKLKVEDNISVQANVKINNDMAILCDTTSIHQNSFIFNSSFELEESENYVKFGHLNEGSELNCFNSDICSKMNTNPNDKLIETSSSQYFLIPAKVKMFNKSNPHDLFKITTDHLIPLHSKLEDLKFDNHQNSSVLLQKSFKCEQSCGCVCCASWYGAAQCLFYLPRDPVFRDSSKAVCDCCSEDSEEDEAPCESDKNEDKSGSVSPVIVKPVSNPGWYGKGYRKRIKKKR